ELLHEDRPRGTRPDQAHLALEDVTELGQLVQAEPWQEGADACPAGIASGRPDRAALRLGVAAHGPELDHPEALAAAPHPLLGEKDGPRRGELDEKCDDGQKG